ncbi:MAG: glycosyltransferase family 39 protein [Bacteroidales bacterium]|nr:glycosyltransferase family 39 protein [Bacteroidales bacterium]
MNSNFRSYLIIFLLAVILFMPFLGQVHLFDWDEVNFAEAAREMIVSHNYTTVQIDFQPFWEKPPLFFWFQVVAMKMFGINEFAARLPNAVAGMLTLMFLFYIGKKHFNKKFAWLWVVVYMSSFLPFLYFKSGIIDPWFNLLIFSGIYFLIFAGKNDKRKYLNTALSASLIGLATLTKGPVAILLTGLTYFVSLLINRFRNFLSVKQILLYLGVFSAIGGLWFIILIVQGHTEIIHEFIVYQIRLLTTKDAGHGGPFYYHFLVLLLGCFPMSVFAIRGFKKPTGNKLLSEQQSYFRQWMLILFWVVLILFSIVKTKIVHYSSLAYFPLSFLAVYGILQFFEKEKISKWIKAGLIGISVVLGLAIAGLPFIEKYKTWIIARGWIHDPFAIANLQATVQWSHLVTIIGVLFILGTLTVVIFVRDVKKSVLVIFLISLITIEVASLEIVPHIEPYSQGPAIAFYQSLKGKDIFVVPLGFKSYAHLFYTDKQPETAKTQPPVDILLRGEINKPAYFVSKITKKEEILKNYPLLEVLYQKNGFVFYRRK